jgi:hypothetical protein
MKKKVLYAWESRPHIPKESIANIVLDIRSHPTYIQYNICNLCFHNVFMKIKFLNLDNTLIGEGGEQGSKLHLQV